MPRCWCEGRTMIIATTPSATREVAALGIGSERGMHKANRQLVLGGDDQALPIEIGLGENLFLHHLVNHRLPETGILSQRLTPHKCQPALDCRDWKNGRYRSTGRLALEQTQDETRRVCQNSGHAPKR